MNNENFQHQSENNQEQTQTIKAENSGLMKMVGQSLPWIPLLFEQFTGQKIPQMTGTIAEMQMVLMQIQASQQAIINSQQNFNQRLLALENNATQQFNNLIQQVQSIKSIRLTQNSERKQIEYNLQSENH
ncbi:MAG: hypothetical protein GBAus27B_000221 [Mycoplasmataceae bacterium]|nr:MAG: hypothetical protein GBAus27B_000221 [Mycoplasmataceae bacterium]